MLKIWKVAPKMTAIVHTGDVLRVGARRASCTLLQLSNFTLVNMIRAREDASTTMKESPICRKHRTLGASTPTASERFVSFVYQWWEQCEAMNSELKIQALL